MQLVYCIVRLSVEYRGKLLARLCASPARRRKAFVTSRLVKSPAAREETSFSAVCSVISISREDSSCFGTAVTLRGSCAGISGIGG